MNKLSILIVDHEKKRGENLQRKISENHYSASHYLYVWGNQKSDNPVCDSKDFVPVTNVNLVHSNNACAREFIDFILSNHIESWVVEYSGGGLEAMGNRPPRTSKHILYPKSIGLDAQFENLHEFFEAVSKQQENAGDILLGYNPLLEAKLELLHACLTPEGRDKVTWDQNGQITIVRDGGEPFKGTIPDNTGKAEFEKLKQQAGGPFGEEYMNALADLRNALLPEHEYAK